jgi:hypothetical protein
MKSIVSNLFFRPHLCVLFVFLGSFSIYSDCIVAIDNCKYDTIGTGSIIASCTCSFNAAVTYRDTITKTGQLQGMKKEFDSLAYCFLGVIDNVIRFKTAPNDSPCRLYDVDSVHVKIQTAYKGQPIHDYWFLDTMAASSCDTSLHIWVEDQDPGYSSIMDAHFIAFTNVLGSLRKSNVITNACFLSGYFIDDRGYILKNGLQWIDQLLFPVNYGTVWIKIPLDEFTGFISGPQQAIPLKPEPGMGHRIIINQTRTMLTIRALHEKSMTVTIYGLNGKTLFSASRQSCNGPMSISFDKRTLSKGIYLVKISGPEAIKTFRINTTN